MEQKYIARPREAPEYSLIFKTILSPVAKRKEMPSFHVKFNTSVCRAILLDAP